MSELIKSSSVWIGDECVDYLDYEREQQRAKLENRFPRQNLYCSIRPREAYIECEDLEAIENLRVRRNAAKHKTTIRWNKCNAPLSFDDFKLEFPDVDCEKPRIGRLRKGALKFNRVVDWCLNHINITKPYSGHYLNSNDYNTTRTIYYDDDREIGLYGRWDSVRETDYYFWARCIYTLGTRVDFEQVHEVGCNGKAQGSLPSLISSVLMQCGCPVRTFNRRQLWLVCPKHLEVKYWEAGTQWSVKNGDLMFRSVKNGDLMTWEYCQK